MSHKVEDLPWCVPAPQDLGSLCVLHVGDDAVTVLYISVLHRHENHVRVQAFDDEVSCVGEQGVILFWVDVWSRWTWLSHGKADEMAVELNAFGS
jgi:hypothetical protein